MLLYMKYLIYLFLYCSTDTILNKLYLSNYYTILDNENIKHNSNFYFSMTNLNIFVLFVYSVYLIKNYKNVILINKTTNALALIYLKYTLNIIVNDNITLWQHEVNRNIMWLFTTPLMLKMFCDVNNIKLSDINIQYHIIPVIINVLIYPYKKTFVYYYFTGFSWIMLFSFIKTLYLKSNLIFSNIYIFIWGIFTFLNILEILQITNKYNINLYYAYADMVSKMMTCIIINDYNENKLAIINNIDLQSVQFISYMIKYIKKYENENCSITNNCNKFINATYKYFLSNVPESKIALEQELLKKILPFNFDIDYIANANANANANTNANANAKHFDMICILFADIVNYTELAKKYDDKIIFQLLSSVYNLFDNILKKYCNLQKIETIGDAYMTVGDIYRNGNNHKIVIKEIILFAIDIITEIKTIQTPDNIPLSLRIGINMGNVSIGILGNELPRLCVVGNAVNVAARLQSTADINTIQMSRHIYEQIEDIGMDKEIEIIKKENVFLKNLGSITTYNIQPFNDSKIL